MTTDPAVTEQPDWFPSCEAERAAVLRLFASIQARFMAPGNYTLLPTDLAEQMVPHPQVMGMVGAERDRLWELWDRANTTISETRGELGRARESLVRHESEIGAARAFLEMLRDGVDLSQGVECVDHMWPDLCAMAKLIDAKLRNLRGEHRTSIDFSINLQRIIEALAQGQSPVLELQAKSPHIYRRAMEAYERMATRPLVPHQHRYVLAIREDGERLLVDGYGSDDLFDAVEKAKGRVDIALPHNSVEVLDLVTMQPIGSAHILMDGSEDGEFTYYSVPSREEKDAARWEYFRTHPREVTEILHHMEPDVATKYADAILDVQRGAFR